MHYVVFYFIVKAKRYSLMREQISQRVSCRRSLSLQRDYTWIGNNPKHAAPLKVTSLKKKRKKY